jgi:hypothetical protein
MPPITQFEHGIYQFWHQKTSSNVLFTAIQMELPGTGQLLRLDEVTHESKSLLSKLLKTFDSTITLYLPLSVKWETATLEYSLITPW